VTPLILRLINTLEEQEQATWHPYTVPGAWVGAHTPVTFSSGASYLLHQLRRLDAIRRKRDQKATWSLDRAVAYNAMVRQATSYDHGPGTDKDGWRSTGTFLKLLGLIPYLHSLDVDTLVLLPITEIGAIGRKGQLGSPYAVKHPFRLDPQLAEPCIDMSVDDQARVFIEICHLLGMKVVLETVLRTVSIDSEYVQGHPNWFYWVDESKLGSIESFRSPTFTADELRTMHEKVEGGDFTHLPEPSEAYRTLFDVMPMKVTKDEHGWKGIGPQGKILRIPGAFADWPPDDPQPAWSDVTYLRLHDHPAYRYMAYNTIRMFERDLDRSDYRQTSLWNTIAGIIPHYIRMFGIDGAMIDMGHALPRDLRSRIVSESRALKADFMLFEENFHITEVSRSTGYDAVIGYLPFDAHDPQKLSRFIDRVSANDIPIRYLATPESHNTPRAAERLPQRAGAALWLFLRFLPRGVSFLHAGVELNETRPVNTGLGFTPEEIAKNPTSMLALFNDVPLPWDTGVVHAEWLIEKLRQLQAMDVLSVLRDDDGVQRVDVDDPDVVAYVRHGSGSRRGILVVVNIKESARTIRIQISRTPGLLFAAPTKGVHVHAGEISIDIGGSDVVVIPTLHRVTSA